MRGASWVRRWLAPAIVVGLALGAAGGAFAAGDDDEEVALNLANLLRSARAVIGAHQDLINEPSGGDKGVTSEIVLEETIARFQSLNGFDPRTVEPDTRMGRLFQAQIAAIQEVVDEHQGTINRPDIGFKGFVPAVFARLVNERFEEKVGDEAQIKVTAPLELVRNRGARPDPWENEHIEAELLDPAWPKGKAFTAVTEQEGRQAFHMLVPEYYTEGCLACHGEPKGAIDITGYPMEGGRLDELGGVISITLFR